jgi:hypothetical protein
MRFPVPLLASLVAIFFCSTLLAKPMRFDLRDPFQRNLLRVDADSPLERTTAIINNIRGFIELDPTNLALGIKGEIQVDLRRLETAVPTKNDFIKEKLLQTSEFPMATIIVEKAVGTPPRMLRDAVSAVVRLSGKATVRNLTQNMEWVTKITWYTQSDTSKTRMPGNLIRISGQQEVDLTPFGISIPDSMKSRLLPRVSILADLMGSDLSTLDLTTLPSY